MGRETKGVVRLFKAIKPVAQVALLIVGVAMVCFGVMRGEADAVLAASVFHFGTFSIRQVKEYMASQGIPVRLDF